MGLELLTQADYVLNACGRPVPPPGFKFVDLPKIIPFHQTIQTIGGQSESVLDENAAGVKFTANGPLAVGTTVTYNITQTGGAAGPLTITGNQATGWTITFPQSTVSPVSNNQFIALVEANTLASQLVTVSLVKGLDADPGSAILDSPASGTLSGPEIASPFPTQDRVENTSATLFLCRGIMLETDPVQVRIKWPNGRYWNQQPSGNPTLSNGTAFPQGTGGNLYALDEEMPIERGAKVAVEMSGATPGAVDIQLWGVLRYLLKATGGDAGIFQEDSSCIVGYPVEAKSLGGCLVGYKVSGAAKGNPNGITMIKDPIEELKERPRFECWPNGNIMAPEFLLGNQCGQGGKQSYTFFSQTITLAAGSQAYSNAIVVPGQDDLVIRRWRPIITWQEGATGTPLIGLRTPSGYSVTGGDLLPWQVLQSWVPMFPTLLMRSGTSLIWDVSFTDNATGTVTVQIEFDAYKRKKR